MGTSSVGSQYGISGENIEWQITAISDHTTTIDSNWTGNSNWSHQTPTSSNPGDLDFTTGDKVKKTLYLEQHIIVLILRMLK